MTDATRHFTRSLRMCDTEKKNGRTLLPVHERESRSSNNVIHALSTYGGQHGELLELYRYDAKSVPNKHHSATFQSMDKLTSDTMFSMSLLILLWLQILTNVDVNHSNNLDIYRVILTQLPCFISHKSTTGGALALNYICNTFPFSKKSLFSLLSKQCNLHS